MDKKSEEFYKSLKERLISETGGTWYSITPHDFEGLLVEPKVTNLLEKWFGVSIKTDGGVFSAVLPSDVEMDLNEIYIRIESDPEMSFEIYQIGMSIWR